MGKIWINNVEADTTIDVPQGGRGNWCTKIVYNYKFLIVSSSRYFF